MVSNALQSKEGERRKVINREPVFYKHARDLIKLFGYYAFTAKGDADAELAELNPNGGINAVLTKDSDVFPFGAVCILRVLPSIAPERSNELEVDVFNTVDIQTKMGISRRGFIIFIALLLSNDITEGLSSAFQRINHDMANELEFDSHRKIGKRKPHHPRRFVSRSCFTWGLEGNPGILNTSHFGPYPSLSTEAARHRSDRIILQATVLLEFELRTSCSKNFIQIYGRLLSFKCSASKSIAYNPSNAEVLATRVEPIQGNFSLYNFGRPFIPTYTTINNKRTLNTKNKKWTEKISVTFSTAILMRLAGLANANAISTRRMNVHAVLISYALKISYQNNLPQPALPTGVPTSSTTLASSSNLQTSLPVHSDEDVIEISDDENF
ncbi:hypothetical protein EV360DRAFT_86812 [Lentinula raphanica]|nr:hypothetical protein EV360DRAFT_86812 [Lentinula raphanica]